MAACEEAGDSRCARVHVECIDISAAWDTMKNAGLSEVVCIVLCSLGLLCFGAGEWEE